MKKLRNKNKRNTLYFTIQQGLDGIFIQECAEECMERSQQSGKMSVFITQLMFRFQKILFYNHILI